MKRRDFLKAGAALAVGAVAPTPSAFRLPTSALPSAPPTAAWSLGAPCMIRVGDWFVHQGVRHRVVATVTA